MKVKSLHSFYVVFEFPVRVYVAVCAVAYLYTRYLAVNKYFSYFFLSAFLEILLAVICLLSLTKRFKGTLKFNMLLTWQMYSSFW